MGWKGFCKKLSATLAFDLRSWFFIHTLLIWSTRVQSFITIQSLTSNMKHECMHAQTGFLLCCPHEGIKIEETMEQYYKDWRILKRDKCIYVYNVAVQCMVRTVPKTPGRNLTFCIGPLCIFMWTTRLKLPPNISANWLEDPAKHFCK